MTIAELREFASFSAQERLYIERSLDIGLSQAGVASQWSESAQKACGVKSQASAYRNLRSLRAWLAQSAHDEGLDVFLGSLIAVTAQDLSRGKLASFSAYRFLYERLLGAKARPWLPSAFCAAAALPTLAPERRRHLLQSLSGAAATAEAWCDKEPVFFPEKLCAEAA